MEYKQEIENAIRQIESYSCVKNSDFYTEFSDTIRFLLRHSRTPYIIQQTRQETMSELKCKPLYPVDIKAPQDVLTLLVATINDLRNGEIDQKTAAAIGLLATQLIKALEAVDEQRRIDAIESTAGILPPKFMLRAR